VRDTFLRRILITSRFFQDLDQEDDTPLVHVDYEALEEVHKEEVASKKVHEETKSQILHEQKGFCKEGGEGDGY